MKNLILTLTLLVSAVSFGQTAQEYFNSGYDKAEANDPILQKFELFDWNISCFRCLKTKSKT